MFETLFTTETPWREQAFSAAGMCLYLQEAGRTDLADQCLSEVPAELENWTEQVLARAGSTSRYEILEELSINPMKALPLPDAAHAANLAAALLYSDLLERKPVAWSYEQFWDFVSSEHPALAKIAACAQFLDEVVGAAKDVSRPGWRKGDSNGKSDGSS